MKVFLFLLWNAFTQGCMDLICRQPSLSSTNRSYHCCFGLKEDFLSNLSGTCNISLAIRSDINAALVGQETAFSFLLNASDCQSQLHLGNCYQESENRGVLDYMQSHCFYVNKKVEGFEKVTFEIDYRKDCANNRLKHNSLQTRCVDYETSDYINSDVNDNDFDLDEKSTYNSRIVSTSVTKTTTTAEPEPPRPNQNKRTTIASTIAIATKINTGSLSFPITSERTSSNSPNTGLMTSDDDVTTEQAISKSTDVTNTSIEPVETGLNLFETDEATEILRFNITDIASAEEFENRLYELSKNVTSNFHRVFGLFEVWVVIFDDRNLTTSPFSNARINDVKVEESYEKVTLVAVQIPALTSQSTNFQYFETKKEASDISVDIFPLKDVPLLSMSAFDRSKHVIIPAQVSYSLSVENDSTVAMVTSAAKEGIFSAPQRVIRKLDFSCQFYHPLLQTYSGDGCRISKDLSKNSEIRCDCNHTTIFAVLLSVESFVIPTHVKVVSLITESVSIFCLIVTLIVLVQVRKKIKNDRIVVQINLSLALLLLHLVNIFHDLALNSSRMCEMVAVLIHYFLLSSAMWMLIEGVTLVIKTSDNSLAFNNKNPSTVSKIKLFFGWGIPGIIVTTTTIVGFLKSSGYIDKVENFGYKRCWLNPHNGILLGSVIIPIAVIYLLNFCMSVKVAVFVYKMSAASKNFKPTDSQQASKKPKQNIAHIKTALKGLIMLFPVLGIPWIFSFLSGLESFEARMVFIYLNVILNGLQGLFVALVYCVFGREVRSLWIQRIEKSFSSFSSSGRKRYQKSNSVSGTQSSIQN
ncbi:unnamed protein product [Clavelina lepadiformis]|uniref:G-protein coupled receptors family 2 profile 2 domain-containing protein n=1 Tax=Clavelina lepadiformis TaxID=159417 RepID=A0ABP0FQ00_CLALP